MSSETETIKSLSRERIARATAKNATAKTATAKRATRRNNRNARIFTFNNLARRKESYPIQITFPIREESKIHEPRTSNPINEIVSSSSDNAAVSVVFIERMGQANNPPPRLRAEFYKIPGLRNNVYELPLPSGNILIPTRYKKVEGNESQKTTRISHEFSSNTVPIFSVTYSADIYLDLTNPNNPRPFVWYLNIKDHEGIFYGRAQVRTNSHQATFINIKEKRIFEGIPIYILDNNIQVPASLMLWEES